MDIDVRTNLRACKELRAAARKTWRWLAWAVVRGVGVNEESITDSLLHRLDENLAITRSRQRREVGRSFPLASTSHRTYRIKPYSSSPRPSQDSYWSAPINSSFFFSSTGAEAVPGAEFEIARKCRLRSLAGGPRGSRADPCIVACPGAAILW
jgi:hypothetical protein